MTKFLIILIPLFFSCHKKTSEVMSSPSEVQEQTSYLQEKEVQLSRPHVVIDSIFFHESASVKMNCDLEDALITYQFNGEQRTDNDIALIIDDDAYIKAWVEKKGFIKSQSVEYELVKLSNLTRDAKISVSPSFSDAYPGNGNMTLLDQQKGSLNFRQEGKWLGFQAKTIEIELNFPDSIEMTQVILSSLSDVGSWIFKPSVLKLRLDNKANSVAILPKTRMNESPKLVITKLTFNRKQKIRSFKLSIESLETIPEWHQGKGTLPWLFIDEIVVK